MGMDGISIIKNILKRCMRLDFIVEDNKRISSLKLIIKLINTKYQLHSDIL